MFRAFKENWYFIKQDIISYTISTVLYLTLCLIQSFTIQTAIYSIFECLVFYIPFWYIRVNFSNTYHSDSWDHCKFCTRLMLCIGIFILWVLPLPYSLFNSLFVAFACCLILYLVAISSDEKKQLKRENIKFQKDIELTLQEQQDPKVALFNRCADLNISARDTQVAVLYYIERYTPKQIWHWLCDHREQMEYDSVYKLLNRLNHKLK